MANARSCVFVVFCTLCAAFMGVSTDAKAGLFVDFGNLDDTLIESGWEGFEEVQSTPTATQTFTSDLGIDGTVDVSVVCDSFRKRGSETGALANLLNDFCRSTSARYGDTFVTLTLANLQPGEYEFTSYNYNSNTSYERGNISISVTDSLGTRTAVDSVDQDDLTAVINTFMLTIDTAGSAEITYLAYEATTDNNDMAILNGFSLTPANVPEPSVLLLLVAGGLVLVGVRHRWNIR